MASALGLVLRIEAEVDQRVVGEQGRHQDIAAVATVAARRPAPGNELFPAKGHAAIAAVSGLDAYFGLIDEHIQSPTYASQFSTSQFSGSRVGYIS